MAKLIKIRLWHPKNELKPHPFIAWLQSVLSIISHDYLLIHSSENLYAKSTPAGEAFLLEYLT